MPITPVHYYVDDDGNVPVRDWLDALSDDVAEKLQNKIERLHELGHEMRRPDSDYLRDGIHELRVRRQHTNFRVLYFFHGRHAIILAHGLTKEREVPNRDIDVAVRRKTNFESSPARHTRKGYEL